MTYQPGFRRDAAITLTQLGLRVQGVTLAQDAADARDQQGAVAVDEHDELYGQPADLVDEQDASDDSPVEPLAHERDAARYQYR